MASALFFINHKKSRSRVAAEFVAVNGKIRIGGVSFIRGKVVDLGAVRACMKLAEEVLHLRPRDPDDFPFTG